MNVGHVFYQTHECRPRDLSNPIVPDMKVRSQLACPEDRRGYENKCCELYICLLYMLSHIPMMFTRIKVLSRLVDEGGLHV
jgi:hypothetical protein